MLSHASHDHTSHHRRKDTMTDIRSRRCQPTASLEAVIS
ncbi:hypothetical protein Y013_08060 [Rhodococcus pyridinivorans SB3094]|uniref:Uncharacterized protein n=1 Tax=Rhodococcus pyridinivorans SB3094 TaxID=1435356 RepID=V9XQL3_9NOCA|nr:hypothetical protein Y013_08060 [Rhodococcus pyridinivorans SB3094]